MASDVPFAGKGSRSRVDDRSRFASNFDKIFRKETGDDTEEDNEGVGTRPIPLVDLMEDFSEALPDKQTQYDGHPIRGGRRDTDIEGE